jgi:hypothetical protein
MGTLRFFTENEKFVIQQITELNQETNRYDTVEDMTAAIMTLPDSVIHEYMVEVERGVDIVGDVFRAFATRTGIYQDSPKKDKESPLQ